MGSHSRDKVTSAMGPKKNKRPKQKLTRHGPRVRLPGGPFVGLFHGASREAKARGLYVLAEGSGADPLWRIYDATTGAVLGFFAPLTRVLIVGHERTTCDSWRHAFDVLTQGKE